MAGHSNGSSSSSSPQLISSNADHLNAIIENVVEGIISIDDRGTILSINPAGLEIFGYSADELIGQNVKMLMPAPYKENHDKYISNYLETGEAKIISTGREVVGLRKNGETFPLELAVGEVQLPGRRLFTGIVRDISERKKADLQVQQLTRSLREKNKELESVVYIASHDLRSPLVNIQGFSIELKDSCQRLTQLLASKVQGEKEQTAISEILVDEIPESLEFIFAGVNKMDALLTGFLNFSRLGRVEMKMEKIDLNTMMDEVLSAMKFQIQKEEAAIEVDHLHRCYADSSQLSQVLTNLINNSLKYCPDIRNPEIRIQSSIFHDNSEIILEISDNGIGIREDHKEKIFDVFFRLQPYESEGEGLGLSIAKRIINRMGGRIWVESDFGIGSRFLLTLPTVPKPVF